MNFVDLTPAELLIVAATLRPHEKSDADAVCHALELTHTFEAALRGSNVYPEPWRSWLADFAERRYVLR